MATKSYIGGSFAPPLDADKLATYNALAHDAPEQIGEAMHKLIDMVTRFQQNPCSGAECKPHPVGVGHIQHLEESEVKRIWDAVPWKEECDMYAKLFDGIDAATNKELRDAAHHLLWFAYELTADREPCTCDKL
jgi:hypothetical protein